MSILALVDFSSSFDPIDHSILVRCLHNDVGCTDAALKCSSSYLIEHTQYVSLSNHCSAFAPVHSGVPHGSFLEPMLFSMYVRSFSAIIDSHSIMHHYVAEDLQS